MFIELTSLFGLIVDIKDKLCKQTINGITVYEVYANQGKYLHTEYWIYILSIFFQQ